MIYLYNTHEEKHILYIILLEMMREAPKKIVGFFFLILENFTKDGRQS